MNRWTLIFAFASLSLATTRADAQHRRRRHRGSEPGQIEGADALYRDGLQMMDRRDWEGAARFFDQLFTNTHAPRALYLRGAAELELGRVVEGERDIRTALQSNDAWIASRRADVEAALRLAQGRVGDLSITTNAPNATVIVNGTEVSGPTVRVAAGETRIAVRAPGFQPLEETVMVPGNVTQVLRHEVTLRPVAEAPTTAVTVATPVTPPTVEPTPIQTPPPPRASSPMRPIGVGLMVAGGAGLVLGAVGLALRAGAVSDFDANGACGANGGSPLGGEACVSAYDSIQTWQAVSIAGLVGGGVLAASGAVLFFLSPGSRSAERASVAPSIGPGSMGLTVSGRF
ncbi:MAG: PEGA domain-containing protein [Polyangiales bacterium]